MILRSEPERRFTARELAEALVQRWRPWAEQKRRGSKQKLDHKGLIHQIMAEIGASRDVLREKYPSIGTTEGQPRRYYWS